MMAGNIKKAAAHVGNDSSCSSRRRKKRKTISLNDFHTQFAKVETSNINGNYWKEKAQQNNKNQNGTPTQANNYNNDVSNKTEMLAEFTKDIGATSQRETQRSSNGNAQLERPGKDPRITSNGVAQPKKPGKDSRITSNGVAQPEKPGKDSRITSNGVAQPKKPGKDSRITSNSVAQFQKPGKDSRIVNNGVALGENRVKHLQANSNGFASVELVRRALPNGFAVREKPRNDSSITSNGVAQYERSKKDSRQTSNGVLQLETSFQAISKEIPSVDKPGKDARAVSKGFSQLERPRNDTRMTTNDAPQFKKSGKGCRSIAKPKNDTRSISNGINKLEQDARTICNGLAQLDMHSKDGQTTCNGFTQLDKPTQDAKLDKPTKDAKLGKHKKDAKLDKPTKYTKLDKHVKVAKLDKPTKDARAKPEKVTFANKPQKSFFHRATLSSDTDSLRGSNRGRGSGCVRSCPCIPTPPRCVPHELKNVDIMTSANFRHDYAAHLETMRMRQKNQQHMQFFQTAIEENQHLFKGRTILVLSCGTGTLALMAARAGAARVYAIDHSNVTDYAQLVVKTNGYEQIIQVLHGRVAELELPYKLDGIVCNWMGHCLLYESELVELLEVRQRWLKPQGFILPDLAALYLLGSGEQLLKNNRCNWWLNVYGFNMNAMRRYALSEPRHAKISGDQLLTLAHKVLSLDLRTANLQDLQIDRDIRLQVQQERYLECFVLYFDVAFSRAHKPLQLSCNPCLGSSLSSNWLQTVLFLEAPIMMRRNKRYEGHLVFKSLSIDQRQLLDLNHMKFEIEFYERTQYDISNPIVLKSWLMLPRFQTTQEVDYCQDRRFASEPQN